MNPNVLTIDRLRLAVGSTDTLEYSVRNIDSSAHTGSLGVMLLCTGGAGSFSMNIKKIDGTVNHA